MKGRIEYIDSAKGMGIALVVIGHVVYGNNYSVPNAETICNFIYSFHMPLFFIISGLCIKESKVLETTVIKKMVRVYLLPYVIWSALYLLVFQIIAVLMKTSSIFENGRFAHAISACGLAPLWFLLALFTSEIIVLMIKPMLKRKWGGYCVLIILVGISICCTYWYNSIGEVSILADNWIIGTMRIAPTTFYVLFGYMMKEPINRSEQLNSVRWKMIVSMIVLQALLCWQWNDVIDVQVFLLGKPWLYFIKGINGSLIVLLIAQSVHSGFLTRLGHKSKELMILHYPPFYYTVILRFLLGKLFTPNYLGLLIISVITIVCCLLVDWMMSRFWAWSYVMGRKL